MESKIKEILKKTEIIINESEIGGEFRPVAFKEVFRILLSSKSDNKELPIKIQKTETDIVINSKPRAKSHGSAAKLVDDLIKQGFFSERRRDIDCVEEINLSKGVKIPRNHMATILVRKLRSGTLKREKTSNGYVYFVN